MSACDSDSEALRGRDTTAPPYSDASVTSRRSENGAVRVAESSGSSPEAMRTSRMAEGQS